MDNSNLQDFELEFELCQRLENPERNNEFLSLEETLLKIQSEMNATSDNKIEIQEEEEKFNEEQKKSDEKNLVSEDESYTTDIRSESVSEADEQFFSRESEEHKDLLNVGHEVYEDKIAVSMYSKSKKISRNYCFSSNKSSSKKGSNNPNQKENGGKKNFNKTIQDLDKKLKVLTIKLNVAKKEFNPNHEEILSEINTLKQEYIKERFSKPKAIRGYISNTIENTSIALFRSYLNSRYNKTFKKNEISKHDRLIYFSDQAKFPLRLRKDSVRFEGLEAKEISQILHNDMIDFLMEIPELNNCTRYFSMNFFEENYEKFTSWIFQAQRGLKISEVVILGQTFKF